MSELPRLAVVSDVEPDRSQGGCLLLYRLLESYPADRLTVLHGNRAYGIRDARLPGVPYAELSYDTPLPAKLRGRWFPLWPAAELAAMRRLAGRVVDALADFRPEAILTVADHQLWAAAAAAAAQLRVPFHLVLHDDLPSKVTSNGDRTWDAVLRWVLRRQFGATYRRAATRFCVSPGMAHDYGTRYGAVAKILYPGRGEDSPQPRVRVRPTPGGPPVAAFAGSLYTAGAIDLLRSLAGELHSRGGELHLYTRDIGSIVRDAGLEIPGVRVAGFFPPREMADRIAESAHALILPASFLRREAEDVSTLFPSKLADYTAIGLPIIAWGPEYSSAVRWVRENSDAASLFTDPDPRPVCDLVLALGGDPVAAAEHAAGSVAAGNRFFSAAATRDGFLSSLVATGG